MCVELHWEKLEKMEWVVIYKKKDRMYAAAFRFPENCEKCVKELSEETETEIVYAGECYLQDMCKGD